VLRLTCVFLVWMASTAFALEDSQLNQEAELHEAYLLAWSEADEEHRELLARAQHAWNAYRAHNCRIIGDECYLLMAHERAAELRYILRGLTEKNDRTIISGHGRIDGTDER
jgi:uncharacterized protein YecT (DUF1311 family)